MKDALNGITVFTCNNYCRVVVSKEYNHKKYTILCWACSIHGCVASIYFSSLATFKHIKQSKTCICAGKVYDCSPNTIYNKALLGLGVIFCAPYYLVCLISNSNELI